MGLRWSEWERLTATASKHSTMKISRSYVNLRAIQVFFIHFYLKLFPMYVQVFFSSKQKKWKFFSFCEKFIAQYFDQDDNSFFLADINFTSIKKIIFQIKFNCTIFAIGGNDYRSSGDHHHPRWELFIYFFAGLLLLTRGGKVFFYFG